MYARENNFMTLQRPTFEELERRRQLRDTLSPQKSTTLQRRESMLSRGFNAIMRRQSFMSGAQTRPKLTRNDSFFMHSSLAKEDVLPPGGMMTNDDIDEHRHPLHTIVQPNNNRGRNLARAKSFKYPEKISQIPPAEFTRLRSKSQIRDSGFGSSIFSKDVLSSSEDTAVYTSGSGGSAVGSGKSVKNRYFDENPAANWLNRERFFQPPPRFPERRPMQKPMPRDISEPPPHTTKKRMPLPDIFYYGDRWQEQENREIRRAPGTSTMPREPRENREPREFSREMPEPPPGSELVNNNANNR